MFQFDTDMMRGLVLVSLLAGFLGIWRWAWSSKRKPGFHDASMLPLEDDEVGGHAPRSGRFGPGD